MKNILIKCFKQINNKIFLFKHLKIALIVGIILNIINQFDLIINMDLKEFDLLKVILTFIVPFSVSVYSAATVNKNICEDRTN